MATVYGDDDGSDFLREQAYIAAEQAYQLAELATLDAERVCFDCGGEFSVTRETVSDRVCPACGSEATGSKADWLADLAEANLPA